MTELEQEKIISNFLGFLEKLSIETETKVCFEASGYSYVNWRFSQVALGEDNDNMILSEVAKVIHSNLSEIAIVAIWCGGHAEWHLRMSKYSIQKFEKECPDYAVFIRTSLLKDMTPIKIEETIESLYYGYCKDDLPF